MLSTIDPCKTLLVTSSDALRICIEGSAWWWLATMRRTAGHVFSSHVTYRSQKKAQPTLLVLFGALGAALQCATTYAMGVQSFECCATFLPAIRDFTSALDIDKERSSGK